MTPSSTPRPYDQWRIDPAERAEDAAYVFGHGWMRYCRTEAMKSADLTKLPKSESELKKRDRYFEARKHLSAKFQRGFIATVVLATFEKGERKHMAEATNEKLVREPHKKRG